MLLTDITYKSIVFNFRRTSPEILTGKKISAHWNLLTKQRSTQVTNVFWIDWI